MRRVVSLWFPTWPTDRLRRRGLAKLPSSAPLVTRVHDGRRLVVGAADAAAQALGLAPGTPLAEAQTFAAGLTIAEADAAGDAAALTRLACWCLRYTPLTAPDPPDGIWLDVTGSTHLAGGEARLLAQLVDRLSRAGIKAHAAIADTPGAAHALARFSGASTALVPPGETRAWLVPLPVAALRLDADSVALLRRLGLNTIGALAAAPRGPLTRRFGTGLLRRLDQALGLVPESIAPMVPPAPIQHRLGFAEPLLTAEAFQDAITKLLETVCARLDAAGQGALRLDLKFERVDGTVQAVRIGTARPSRAPRHLAGLLAERLERIDPGLGVEAMCLLASLTAPLRPWQQSAGLEADPEPEARLAPLLDRLRNRFGQGRVYQVALLESDVPERSFRRLGVPDARWLPEPFGTALTGWPRPARLLAIPQPIQVLSVLPDHPPAAFVWRRVRHLVQRADGPERITGEWWRSDRERTAVRDYWVVEDETGRRFWLFRHGEGTDPETGDLSWYLHGLF